MYGVVRRILSGPRVGAASADGLALATALLWTVHPLGTEAVVYLVQRTELLMALCLLGTLYAFLRASVSARPARWYAASVAACAVGMGCKEVMVAAPLVVWIADATFVAGGFGAALRARRAYYAGLAATWGVLALLVVAGGQRHATGLDLDLGVTPLQYLWTQSRAILLYLRLALWPHPLALYYDWKPAAALADAWPSVAAVTALCLATAYGVARRLPVAFAGAVFFLVLAPTSSLLPIPTELVAERRMYLPLAAVLALVVIGAHRLMVRATGETARRVGPALVGVAAVALGATAFARVLDYRTEESIWRDTVAKAPESALVRNNYGRALANLGRQDEAIAQYREGLRLEPDDARTWAKLGNALAEQGKLAEAVDAYRAALRYEPTDEKTHNNLARVLLRVGRPARRDRAPAGGGPAGSVVRARTPEPREAARERGAVRGSASRARARGGDARRVAGRARRCAVDPRRTAREVTVTPSSRRILLPLLSLAIGSIAAVLVAELAFRVLGLRQRDPGRIFRISDGPDVQFPGRAGHAVVDLYVSNPRGAFPLDLRDEATTERPRPPEVRARRRGARAPSLRRAVLLQLPRLPGPRACAETGGRAPDRVRGRLVRGGAGRRRERDRNPARRAGDASRRCRGRGLEPRRARPRLPGARGRVRRGARAPARRRSSTGWS